MPEFASLKQDSISINKTSGRLLQSKFASAMDPPLVDLILHANRFSATFKLRKDEEI